MTLENFTKIINGLLEEIKAINDLNRRGVNLIDLLDPYHSVIGILFKEIYGEDGYDWFTWFVYDNDYGRKGLKAWDEDKNQICYDIESLWKHLEEKMVKRDRNENNTEELHRSQ